MKDVEQHGELMLIRIPETKTKVVRSFTLEKEYSACVRKYISLRPNKAPPERFFLNFQNGKCTMQPIGRNKFLGIPKLIATYLDLPNSEQYTGHSFRRTSATLLADAGGDMTMLKRHGGWRSTSVVEGYVENSVNNKRKIGALISDQINAVSTDVTEMQSTTVTLISSQKQSLTHNAVAIAKENLAVDNINNAQSIDTNDNSDILEPPRKKQQQQAIWNFNNSTINIHYH